VGIYVNGAWRTGLPLSQASKGGELVSAEVLKPPTPYALHPTPYTLRPAPDTRHPTPYTLHPCTPSLYTSRGATSSLGVAHRAPPLPNRERGRAHLS